MKFDIRMIDPRHIIQTETKENRESYCEHEYEIRQMKRNNDIYYDHNVKDDENQNEEGWNENRKLSLEAS